MSGHIGATHREPPLSLAERPAQRFSRVAPLIFAYILFVGPTAAAVDIYFGPPSTLGPLDPGQQVTVEVFLDTEGETNLDSLFVSVYADPNLLTFVSGTSPGQILFNFSTFSSVARVSHPFEFIADDLGFVRAAAFTTAAVGGGGTSSSAELLATLTFEAANGPGGTANVEVIMSQGDGATVSFISIGEMVTLGLSDPIQVNVPEPTSASLIGAGVFGLILASRQRRKSRKPAEPSSTSLVRLFGHLELPKEG